MGKGLWWDLDSASACHPPRSEDEHQGTLWDRCGMGRPHCVYLWTEKWFAGNSESVYGGYGRDGKYVGTERQHALGLGQGCQDWGWAEVFGWSEHMHLLGAGKMQVLKQWSRERGPEFPPSILLILRPFEKSGSGGSQTCLQSSFIWGYWKVDSHTNNVKNINWFRSITLKKHLSQWHLLKYLLKLHSSD